EVHLNLAGMLHGGVIATLADVACGLAYRTRIATGTMAVTSSLTVTYLAGGGAGVVTARGRVLKRGGRFGYAEADVVDATGTLLARASATFSVLPDRAP
ncbi:MAG TPA: PaaI family thioesterase, partial [Actinomycetota bacterium]